MLLNTYLLNKQAHSLLHRILERDFLTTGGWKSVAEEGRLSICWSWWCTWKTKHCSCCDESPALANWKSSADKEGWISGECKVMLMDLSAYSSNPPSWRFSSYYISPLGSLPSNFSNNSVSTCLSHHTTYAASGVYSKGHKESSWWICQTSMFWTHGFAGKHLNWWVHLAPSTSWTSNLGIATQPAQNPEIDKYQKTVLLIRDWCL